MNFPNVKTKEINGKQVQIYLLPATQGIKTALELSKTIVPAFTTLTEAMNSDSEVSLTTAATTLVYTIDDIDALTIIKQLLNHLTINHNEVDFDEYFMANYGELFEILKFALEENFSSFFPKSVLKDFKSLTLPTQVGQQVE